MSSRASKSSPSYRGLSIRDRARRTSTGVVPDRAVTRATRAMPNGRRTVSESSVTPRPSSRRLRLVLVRRGGCAPERGAGCVPGEPALHPGATAARRTPGARQTVTPATGGLPSCSPRDRGARRRRGSPPTRRAVGCRRAARAGARRTATPWSYPSRSAVPRGGEPTRNVASVVGRSPRTTRWSSACHAAEGVVSVGGVDAAPGAAAANVESASVVRTAASPAARTGDIRRV